MNAVPLPKMENASDVRDMVARLIVEVYAGKLHPRIAAGLAPLMNLQLRTIEATDLERRLARLEKALAVSGGKMYTARLFFAALQIQVSAP